MSYYTSASTLADKVVANVRRVKEMDERIAYQRRLRDKAMKERKELRAKLKAGQKGEAEIIKRGGIPHSDTLKNYHNHGCGLHLQWGDEMYCGFCGGIFVREEFGWMPKGGKR